MPFKIVLSLDLGERCDICNEVDARLMLQLRKTGRGPDEIISVHLDELEAKVADLKMIERNDHLVGLRNWWPTNNANQREGALRMCVGDFITITVKGEVIDTIDMRTVAESSFEDLDQGIIELLVNLSINTQGFLD